MADCAIERPGKIIAQWATQPVSNNIEQCIEIKVMNSNAALYQPFHLKGLTLPNRIVMAPMTRQKSPHQVPTDDVAAYYRRRAEGGVGLIITEGTATADLSASNNTNIPAFFGEASLNGWTKVLQAVKAANGHIMPQLWHQGIRRAPNSGPYPDAPVLSPSGIDIDGRRIGEPMTISQIEEVITGFATSAANAKRIGFDGIELHGAHGYLIDEFLWDTTNKREDSYGGTIAKRAKFAIEVISAVRRAVGLDFPIIFRFSQWKLANYSARLVNTPAALEACLAPLAKAGVDIFHASTRRFWIPEFPETGSDLNLAGWAKKVTGVPSITVGSVTLDAEFDPSRHFGGGIEISHMERLNMMMERGDFDLVAVGRALIANPDWANTVKAGRMDMLKGFEPAMRETLI
jgi:2,4-dienoyl-CoA reductase-like NADH-dependent reductase (Old Yellow Enzyme family)